MDKQRKKYLRYIGYIVDDLLERTKSKNYELGKLYRFPWCDIALQHCEMNAEYVESLYENLDPDDVFPPQVEKWIGETYGIKGGEYPLIMDIYLTHLTDG
jgi:hypothetical protein